ncbi:hypothetical protein PG984_004899 [Apiospora sp. TS-2023a]
MADIEFQGQGDGKTERPSYTRLCTYKILPISLVICTTSIFSAAIVCTSLDKPIPPNAVIVISTIAGSLLLLILAGYLKIYHDRNGMDKVHPRAEEALKAFRDGFVSHLCCVEMDDYATFLITRNNPGEGEKTAPKGNGGEGNVQSGIRVARRAIRILAIIYDNKIDSRRGLCPQSSINTPQRIATPLPLTSRPVRYLQQSSVNTTQGIANPRF